MILTYILPTKPSLVKATIAYLLSLSPEKIGCLPVKDKVKFSEYRQVTAEENLVHSSLILIVL